MSMLAEADRSGLPRRDALTTGRTGRPQGASGRESLGALLYLDWRQTVNGLGAVVRSPRRLLAWSLYLLWILPSLALRALAYSEVGREGMASTQFLPSDLALLAPGVVLLVGGVAMRIPCDRAPAVFTSQADGRFLCGSSIPVRTLILWLQLRTLVKLFLRIGLFLGLQVVILANVLDAGQRWIVVATIFFGGGLLALEAVKLPFFLLVRRHPRLPLRPITTGIALVGLLSIAVAVLQLLGYSSPSPLVSLVIGLPTAVWAVILTGGSGMALALVVTTIALLIALSLVAGDDYLPELWAASVFVLAFRQSLRSGVMLSSQRRRELLRHATGSEVPMRQMASPLRVRWVPPGAWTVIWKRWVGVVRTPWGNALPWGTLVAAVIVGAILGRLLVGHRTALVTSTANVVVFWMIFGNLYATVNLAGDLGKPIWWLAADDLRARLLAWAAGRALLQWVLAATVIVAADLVAHFVDWRYLVAILAGSLGVLAYLQALTLSAYAVLPSPADLRGPGVVLRLLLAWALLLPVVIVGTVVGVISRGVAPGIFSAALLGTIEALLLFEFTTRRLQGNAFAFVRQDRR